jgi:hypothetical protein
MRLELHLDITFLKCTFLTFLLVLISCTQNQNFLLGETFTKAKSKTKAFFYVFRAAAEAKFWQLPQAFLKLNMPQTANLLGLLKTFDLNCAVFDE